MGAPADWYADPAGSHRRRWWDGACWTWRFQSLAGALAEQPPAATSADRPPHPSLERRLVATLLEWAIFFVLFYGVSIASGIVGAAVAVTVGGPTGRQIGTVFLAGGTLVALFLTVLFHPLAEGRTGQTYGKHLAGVAVVNADTDRPIGTWRAIARNLVKSLGLTAVGLGWLWAIRDPDDRTWHDQAVGAVVIEAPVQRLGPIAFARHVLFARSPRSAPTAHVVPTPRLVPTSPAAAE